MKIKKHIALPIVLFIYVTVMGIIFIPQNHASQITEKIIVLIVSYLIVVALYFVLKKKEKYKQERENGNSNKHK